MTTDRARPSLLSPPRRGRVRQLIARRRRMVAAVLVGVAAAGLPSPVVASSGGGRRITDAENTRTVYLVVAALVLLAIGLAVFTWWFWRSTRREHEALAPLEVMSDRKFVAGDTLTRQVLLDGNRPVGAAPLAPGAPEPLILPAADEPATETGDAPATTVIAAGDPAADVDSAAVDGEAAAEVQVEAGADVDAEVDVATGRTDPPSAVDGEATTVVEVEPGAEAADLPADETDEPEPAEANDGTDEVDEVEHAEATDEADDVAGQVPPSSVADDVRPSTNGAAPMPIDPGLPVPPADEQPVRDLSLAELVALEGHAPLGFDDDQLASTPSTGIPVIESAEAWVERQLVGSNGEAVNGHGDLAHDAVAAEGDDPDEPTPAAMRGAD